MPKEVTEIAVAISQPLGVEPGKILDFLTVHIGDVVNKQSILASKKGLFGLGGLELKSPVEGIVHNIDLENGVIVINLGSSKDIFPLVASQKEKEKSQESIKPKPESRPVHTGKFKRSASSNYDMIEGIFGCGASKGVGWFVEYGFDSKSILPEMENRILLVTSMPTMSEVYKASAIGVGGIAVATKDIDAHFLQKLRNDLSGKSHIGFLVLPANINLATLHGVLMEIDGEGKRLLYEKK
jgi:hypothetical protein